MNRFKIALTELGVVLRQEVTAGYINGMAQILSEFSEDALIAAVRQHGKSSEFLPKPVNLIDIMQGGGVDDGTLRADAAAAWGRLAASLSDARAVADLCRQSPRVRAGVEALGGWYAAAHSDEAEPFKRKRFIEGFCAGAREERKAIAGGAKQIGGGADVRLLG